MAKENKKKKEEKDLQVEAYNENNPPTDEQVLDSEILEEELYLTDKEKEDLKTQTSNVKSPGENPDYLEYSAEAVGYANRTEQWATYRAIANYFGDGDSVLDYGCGRGDFERFYQTEFRTDIDYIGIEMNEQLVNASKKAYNDEVDIRCLDWFNIPKDVECDWSVNIGSNNLRYDADTKRGDTQYMHDTIKSMMRHCKKGTVVLLTSDLAETEDGLINWNAGDVLNWANKEFGNVALDHSISNDVFILIIYKNEK